MKQKNRLLDFDMVIYQDNDYFKFSLDSVLLVNFVTLNLKCKRIMDLASGNAPIPMLLTYRTKAHIYGVEIQKEVYNLGRISINENKMTDQITLINDDINNLPNTFESDTFDVITCNPPYFKYKEGSLINQNENKMIARHEVCTNLEEVIKISSYILKTNGTMALVHRPERLMDILFLMRKYNIEPKKKNNA